MGTAGGSTPDARPEQQGGWSPVWLTGAGWALATVVTVLIVGTPYLLFGYHDPDLHLVLTTVDACVAALAAFLVYGRFRREGRLQDSLLSMGLLMFTVAGLGVLAGGGARPGTLDVWLPLAVRVAAALLIAAASLAGSGDVPRAWRGRSWLVPLLVLGPVLLALWAARHRLPVAIDASAPDSALQPVISGHPVLLLLQALVAACFLLASVMFTVQAVRRHDELLRWLGPACALGGFARVNYLLFPSLYSGWLYTGDLLRTGFYLLLLVGAAREISGYWRAQARLAVLEDRRRFARELHDGVLQELGYIRAQVQRPSDPQTAARLVAACDRAIDEARGALAALVRGGPDPVDRVLSRTAEQVAERYGAVVEWQLDGDVSVDPHQRHALLQIVREAVGNAVRHGGARRVRLHLAVEDGLHRLLVHDDGAGFDPTQPGISEGGGFGMVSMRERAEGLPGTLRLESAPGRGTSVEVIW